MLTPSELLRRATEGEAFEGIVPEFTGPICRNLKELSDSCIDFYKSNNKKMMCGNIRKRRSDLSSFIENFHSDCETLTTSVQKGISALRNGNCVVLMSGHQPNFFAYSGVLRKATLLHLLAREIRKRLGIPVINFFLIADQDFASDRWVRSSLLPSVIRKDGTLRLAVNLSKDEKKLMLSRLPKPSREVLDCWKNEIQNWIRCALTSVARTSVCNVHALGLKKDAVNDNFESFWKVVDNSYDRCRKFSDFNAFIMSKIVNCIWGYDTLFARASECLRIFQEEISFVLSHHKHYSKLHINAEDILTTRGIITGVSNWNPKLAPFWYHCNCGSKVKLFLAEHNDVLLGYGNCLKCNIEYQLGLGKTVKPDITGLLSRISVRAIANNLIYSKGLGLSCYVGGIAGFGYLMETRYIASNLGIPFPPTPIWRPFDRYLGIGQIEALHMIRTITGQYDVHSINESISQLKTELTKTRKKLRKLEKKKLTLRKKAKDGLKEDLISTRKDKWNLYKKIRILKAIPKTLNVIPSIIDYVVNVGLKETSDQWIEFLDNGGNLFSDVQLRSVFGRHSDITGFSFGFHENDS